MNPTVHINEITVHNEAHREELRRKIEAVRDLNSWTYKYVRNFENITYKIYTLNNRPAYEFLVITFKGGTTTVRNCTGNSIEAIAEEVAKQFYHGDYDDLPFYNNNIKNKLPEIVI